MAYIGQGIKNGTFAKLDTSGNTYNGSNVTFSLGTQVGSPVQLLVSHDGVIQNPGTDYTLASNGTQITFTTAPASGASIFIMEISGAVGGPMNRDLNGEELILDVDGDTSITADTDDQIDFKIAGADDLKMTANAINVLSGTTLTIDSGATITNSGTANGFGTDPDGAQVFNESGADVDFRVETNSNANMLFISGGNDVVGIGAEGDLGVGLHVKSADSGASVSGDADEAVFEASGHGGITLLNGTSHEGSINFGDSGDNDIGRLTYDHSANAMFMITNGSIRTKIDSDGTFMINRTSNNGSYPGLLSVNRATNAITATIENTVTSGLGASILKVIGNQNTTNSSYNLIDGHNVAANGRFLVRDSGSCQNTNNSYGAISDERVKQDITDASSQWEDIKALKIRNFKLKTNTSKTLLGVVAQEIEASGMTGLVEDAAPEKEDVALHSDFGTAVDGTADNGATPIYEKDEKGNNTDKIIGYEDIFTAGQKVKSVKYSVLYMKAIKALQEAITKIETLETKVKALEDA